MTTLLAVLLALTQPPDSFLASHPELRLLALEDAIAPEDREWSLREGYFRPFEVSDVNGDDHDDLVMVLVDHATALKRFGVIVIPGGPDAGSGGPLWMVPLSPRQLMGVSAEGENGRVVPLYCAECDSNPFFRWNGLEFEEGLERPGDLISLAEAKHPWVTLRSTASDGSAPVARLGRCTTVAVVEALRSESGERWYQVRSEDGATGFVPGRIVAKAGGECTA